MDDQPRKEYPPSPARLSKTPSWIMLGFVLGALFVIALPPRRKEAPPPTAPAKVETPPPAPAAPLQLTTIEAVFAEWGKYAVWAVDTTEVALWNTEKRAFADLYEVRRFGDVYYFRTIPKLTRRIITRGKPMPESPLLFTETEEQYREWHEHGRRERPMERDWRPSAPILPAPQVKMAPARPKVEGSATAPALEEIARPFDPPPPPQKK